MALKNNILYITYLDTRLMTKLNLSDEVLSINKTPEANREFIIKFGRTKIDFLNPCYKVNVSLKSNNQIKKLQLTILN
jgi:hypothetical protein